MHVQKTEVMGLKNTKRKMWIRMKKTFSKRKSKICEWEMPWHLSFGGLKRIAQVHMVWKKDQTVTWGPLPVLQSTENSEKKWWKIPSVSWLQSSGWGTQGVSPQHPNLSSTHQTGCMWMTELQEEAGACSGDQQSPPILTPDLSKSMLWTETRGSTSRNNCIFQILPGATLHTGI